LIGERPAEETKVGPEIEQLWRVNRRHMVRLVSKDNAPINQNEGAESCDQSDERMQDPEDIDHSLGLGEEFQRARNDGDNGFSVVWTQSKSVVRPKSLCKQRTFHRSIPHRRVVQNLHSPSCLEDASQCVSEALLLYMDSLTSSCP
jgi:hypothetical protein